MGRTIGILGGMGPLATLDLFDKIIKNTVAQKDQDHQRIIIYNNPKIPPRDKAYFEGEARLISELQRSALLLEQAGADFIIMPCHTSHIWIEQIQNKIKIPLYSLVENTVRFIQKQNFTVNDEILLLASATTVKSRIYQKAFQAGPIKLVIPTDREQATVSSLIEQVKSGFICDNSYLQPFQEILRNYQKKGVVIILGACTEIPILYPFLDENLIKIDPTLLIAKMAIEKALDLT